ncbi:MAG: ankyrin repeat domain-containing protein [Rickettsiales bacterium]|nr:ankyrin repeat domain-containing protein [Rickettsiales bacterium]
MNIENKILKYLEKELAAVTNPIEQENRLAVIKDLRESEGECSGLSTMWAYSRMTALSEAPTFFNRTNKILLDWDEERDFSTKEKEDVERFVADVLFYQGGRALSWRDSLDLLKLSPDADGREFQHSYKTDLAFLSEELLRDRLEKIIQPNAMILIASVFGSSGHRFALYQKSQGGEIYYYNSHNREERIFDNAADLTDCVWYDTAKKESDGHWKYTDDGRSQYVGDSEFGSMLRNMKADVVQFSGAQYSKPSRFSPSAEENESFLQPSQTRDKIVELIAGGMKKGYFKDYFVSLDAKSQIDLINGSESPERKEILIQLLVNNLLMNKVGAIPNREIYVTDPAIADYLMSDHENVVRSLVVKKLIQESAPNLLLDKQGFIGGEGPLARLNQTFEAVCKFRDFDKVKSLLKMGADMYPYGNSLNLINLIERDRDGSEIISFLLEENKLDLYKFMTIYYGTTKYDLYCGKNPIVLAARFGTIKNLELMVLQLDLGRAEENEIILGQALCEACFYPREDVAKFLLEKGANPNAIDQERLRLTPLELVAQYPSMHWGDQSSSIAIARDLILHGADAKKGTPLIYAGRNYEIAKLLLENGASAEEKEYDETLLIKACKNRDVKMVKLLLEKGANPNACDRYDQSPMQHIEFMTNYRPEQITEIQELLLEYGAREKPATRNVAVTAFAKELSKTDCNNSR